MIFEVKIYQFSKISARCFPTNADLNNPWIFPKDVACVVNVSQKYDQQIADEIQSRGAVYYHYPLDEEVDDIGWENIKKAVETLFKYDNEGMRMIVHCDFGQHRSRLVVEAFYFAKYAQHLIDEYKGYNNHLIYDCCSGYLPSLSEAEACLKKLM